jgi:hypothetical protein
MTQLEEVVGGFFASVNDDTRARMELAAAK